MNSWHTIKNPIILGWLALPIWWLLLMILFSDSTMAAVGTQWLYFLVTLLGFTPALLFWLALRQRHTKRAWVGIVLSAIAFLMSAFMFVVGIAL